MRLGARDRLTTREVEAFLPEEVVKQQSSSSGSLGLAALEAAEEEVARVQDELLEGGRGRGSLQERERMAVQEASRCYRDLEEAVVTRSQVVVCTTLTAARSWLLQLLRDGHISLVCVDEAGFSLDAPLLPLLASCRRLLLAGDHLQLPPVVLSAGGRRRGLGTSLLERLAALRPSCLSLLSTQHRSHPTIAAWSSFYFYEDKLRSAPGLEERTLGALVPELGSVWGGGSLVWIDTRGRLREEEGEGSHSNKGEAALLAKLALGLLDGGLEEGALGVVAPYWGQVGQLRRLLWEQGGHRGVEVSTVDGYQGREKEVVVV